MLSLWYGLPYVSWIICKSGLLIFIFAEQSYLVRQYIYPHYVEWNTLVPSELGSPCLSFSLSFFLSLRPILWSAEACWAHFLARACKTLVRGCLVPTWSSASPVSRALLVFCVNQGISASFSFSFTFLSSTLDHQVPVHQRTSTPLYIYHIFFIHSSFSGHLGC